MDNMKIELTSKFMRNMASDIAAKTISSKLGCKADIQINEIMATVTDNGAHVHISFDGNMTKEEFYKLISSFKK
jgi:hypothetical protein